MSVGEILVSLISTIVSVVLYLLMRRQTVGARQESVRSGNGEIEKILVRRIVLEDFEPSAKEIGRLIDAKARDFRVSSSDLLSEAQLMNNVFTRIVESDLLPQEQRQKLVRRLTGAIETMEATPDAKTAVGDVVTGERMSGGMRYALPMLAGMAAAIGTTLSVLPDIGELVQGVLQARDVLVPAIVTASVSLMAMFVITMVSRLREDPNEEPGRMAERRRALEFEAYVARALDRIGAEVSVGGPRDRYDFAVEQEGRKILIEAKNWRKVPTRTLVRSTVDWLRAEVARKGASHAVVVTPKPIDEDRVAIGGAEVRFMTLRQLRQHLAVEVAPKTETVR